MAVVRVFVYISTVSTTCIFISLEAVKCNVYNILVWGTWVCGESWLAIKDSLTHRPSSQGWASKCPIIHSSLY